MQELWRLRKCFPIGLASAETKLFDLNTKIYTNLCSIEYLVISGAKIGYESGFVIGLPNHNQEYRFISAHFSLSINCIELLF